MLTTLLLLGALYVFSQLSPLFLLISIGMLVAATSKTRPRRVLLAAGGIVLMIPSGFVSYVLMEKDILDGIQRLRYWRGCVLDRSVRTRGTPVQSEGVRLIETNEAAYGFGRGVLHDATAEPRYYLGADGGPKFAFVEAHGKRYSGAWSHPVIEPIGESRAAYAISARHAMKRKTSYFEIDVRRQWDGQPILRVTGSRHLLRMCPSEAKVARLLRDSVVPYPAK